MSATPKPDVPTLALKRRQAAQAVSLGVDAFDQYVKPHARDLTLAELVENRWVEAAQLGRLQALE